MRAADGAEHSRFMHHPRVAALLSNLLIGSRFLPIWLATGVLFVVCAIIAPATLTDASFSAILPLMTFVAVAALGQTLVILTGGIDLSIPGVIVLVAHVLVGVSSASNGRLPLAIVVCLLLSAAIGLVSGILVAVFGFNPLIVTLAVGQILIGVTLKYAKTIANEAQVPQWLATFSTSRFLGISSVFWLGVALTILLALFLRSTRIGRRFQTVGANPRAAWIAGVRVRSYVVFAYVIAATFSGLAGILIAGFIQSPSLDLGDPYLLAPIAAVVLAGASLTGGLTSVTSTWVAAFALTLLNQMLRVLGLSSAMQYVVFGAAILVGTVMSGDRIAALVGPLLQRPGAGALFAAADTAGQEPDGRPDNERTTVDEGVADTGLRLQ
jgi:ribose transport system permease protein